MVGFWVAFALAVTPMPVMLRSIARLRRIESTRFVLFIGFIILLTKDWRFLPHPFRSKPPCETNVKPLVTIFIINEEQIWYN